MISFVHKWQFDVLFDFALHLFNFIIEYFKIGHAVLNDENNSHIHDNYKPVL